MKSIARNILAPAIIFTLIAAGFLPLIMYSLRQKATITFDPYIWRVLRFTLMQAALSTLLSVIPAIFVARALARRTFPGKNIILALFAVPLSIPVIVAVLGITQIYGNNGWLGGAFNLYGLTGILIAHVFFNLPLATRIFHEAHQTIPPETHRLAAQLDLRGAAFFHTVEWPHLKPALISASVLIFLLCAASFVIVLTLGGGPSASTLEVAIYQSLRQDFDIARAVSLALVQLALCSILIVAVSRNVIPQSTMPLKVNGTRYDGKTPAAKLRDAFWILTATIIVTPPLLSIVIAGMSGFQFSPSLPQALLTSIIIGSTAAFITVVLAWSLATGSARNCLLARMNPAFTLAGLIFPPAVIATGWFIALKAWNGSTTQALAMIIMLNALMALPFASAVLRPGIERNITNHDRLCAQMNITGIARLRIVDLPSLKRPLLQALLMAFVLSLGDLTAVTLLGSQGIVTLPSLISQQMGNYRSAAAGGTALILATICYGMTTAAARLSRTS